MGVRWARWTSSPDWDLILTRLYLDVDPGFMVINSLGLLLIEIKTVPSPATAGRS